MELSDTCLPAAMPPPADTLSPTSYKLWDYEHILRDLEVSTLFNDHCRPDAPVTERASLEFGQKDRWKLQRLTFASGYATKDGLSERTWQRLLENGDSAPSKRRETKYVTHGIHAYKGKFYPQLAKSLLNIAGIDPGAVVLDPFCGSGTVLLEGYLNGFDAYGCDMNPLAVKISRAKTEVLTLPQCTVEHTLNALARSLRGFTGRVAETTDQFPSHIIDEVYSWFPTPVVYKLNWLLGQIRLFGEDRLVNFLEVLVSDCIRKVSHQDPTDLRSRRRAELIADAPLIELFLQRLEAQRQRLEQFWTVSGRRPFPFLSATVAQGDCRDAQTFGSLGLGQESVDAVVTSPPYATALPYIDTDRLSLMAILGMPAKPRRTVEERLTGSREILKSERAAVESLLFGDTATDVLPGELVAELRELHRRNLEDGAGFRRLNMPALLYRYFSDMRTNLVNVANVLRAGGKAFYVVGDSKTKVSGEWFPIRTTEWLMRIADQNGLRASKLVDISVPTEYLKHIRNSITENSVLVFEKR